MKTIFYVDDKRKIWNGVESMKIMHLKYSKKIRKGLRDKMTWSENIFWNEVRDRKSTLGNIRRQVGIAHFVVDFFHAKTKLIIEIDGSIHETEEAKQYDAARTAWFIERSYKIIRFTNKEVQNELVHVIKKLEIKISSIRNSVAP